MRITVIIIYAIISINCFSQKVEVLENKEDKSISIQAGNYEWFDDSGNAISREQFDDSLKTRKYQISILGMNTPVAKIQLVNLYPKRSEIINRELPLLTYTDLLGQSIKIGGNTNISLLSFWSVTCGPCIRELSVFNALAEEYPGVEFYAVTKDSRDCVAIFLKEKNYKWDNLVIIPGYREEDYKLGISVNPVNVIIDKKRIVRDVFFGGGIRPIIASLEVLDRESGKKD